MIYQRFLISQYRRGVVFECSNAFGIGIASLCILLHLISGERALSQDTDTGTWRLTFQLQTEEMAPYLDKTTSSSETVTLLIGTQSYEFRKPDITTLYTTQRKTKVELYHRTKEHVEMPMHAVVWFLNSELVNRDSNWRVYSDCRIRKQLNFSRTKKRISNATESRVYFDSSTMARKLWRSKAQSMH